MAKKFSARDFKLELAELAASLRRTIEAEDVGFDPSATAIAQRRDHVNDPVGGYAYFVENYFPHYVRHQDKSELHKYLFKRLPEIVASAKGENDAIAAPVAKPNLPWSVSCSCCGASFAPSSITRSS